MKKINKILVVGSVVILALFGLFVGQGYCTGEIQHPFIPANTYPNQAQFDARWLNMPVDFKVVDGGVVKVVIMVDIDHSRTLDDYYTLALTVKNNIEGLMQAVVPPIVPPVVVNIVDDDTPVDWNKNVILIGNYATNAVIEEWVYKNFLQSVDINRPGANNFVINNVRIGNGSNHTTALVLASQSFSKLANTVGNGTYQLNYMIANSVSGNNIVIGPGQNYGNYSTVGNLSQEFSSTSKNLGQAIAAANIYWLNGQEAHVAIFNTILHNYGAAAQQINGPGFNNVVGDNSGALDFHLAGLTEVWRRLERCKYFIDRPADRLYITQLLNWMFKEYYQCSNTGAAFGYAASDGYPLGNHELSAALGYAEGGKYFSEEGWNFNQIAQGACPPGFPHDYAGGWTLDSDAAFDVYLTLTYANDDSVSYFMSDPDFTRSYCWIKHNQGITNQYFGTSGGLFNTGVDRGVADLFCIVSPNKCTGSVKTAGFGDTHGFAYPDFMPWNLRFWAEQYRNLDDLVYGGKVGGKYAWMCGPSMYNTNTFDSSDWGKGWLQFGLINVTPVAQPLNYLGIQVIPLEEQSRRYLNSFDDGRESYGQSQYDDPLSEVHLRSAFQGGNDYVIGKVALRSGYDTNDQYMALDCAGGSGHGHDDALAIGNYQINNRCFLADHAYDNRSFATGGGNPLDPSHAGWTWENINFRLRDYHNALSVKKGSAPAVENSSTAAALRNEGDFAKTGFVDLELPEYGNFTRWSDWGIMEPDEWRTILTRTLFWKKKTATDQGYFLVLDMVKLHDTASSGSYQATLNWRSLHDGADLSPFTGEGGNKLTINQTGEHCVIDTLDLNSEIHYSHKHTPIPEGEGFPSNYPANAGIFDNSTHPNPNPPPPNLLNTPYNGNLTGTLSRIYASTASHTLSNLNDKIVLPSLIYTYSDPNTSHPYPNPNYTITSVLSGETIYHITSSVNNENVYLGKALNSQEKAFAGYSVMANLFYFTPGTTAPGYISLVNAYKLAQGTQLIFDSSNGGTTYIPASIEFDFNTKTGIVEVNQTGGSVINLYANQQYQVQRLDNGIWANISTAYYPDNRVEFTAEEGKYEYRYITSSGNQPPVLAPIPTPQQVSVGNTLNISLIATDPNQGDILTFSYTPSIPNAQINSTTGAFTFTPQANQAGISYPVTFTVTDQGELFDEQAVTINVLGGSVNLPPVFTYPGPQTIVAGNNFNLTITASDPENDLLAYSASNLPLGATFNATTHIFSWTPTVSQIGGPYNAIFSVTDNINSPVNMTVPITVTAQPQQGNNVALGKTYTLNRGSDPTYKLTNGIYASASHSDPEWVTWSAYGENYNDIVIVMDLGQPYNISSVSLNCYGGGGWGMQIFFPLSIEVSTSADGVSYSPAVTIIPVQFGSLPLYIDTFEGYFSSRQARYVQFIVEPYPAPNGYYTKIDEIQVLADTMPPPPPNQPPVIAPIAPVTVVARQTATVNVSATDPDNDPITLTVAPLGGKSSFVNNGNGTGTFILHTTSGMAGNTYQFTLTATDNHGATDTEIIVINVTSRQGGAQ